MESGWFAVIGAMIGAAGVAIPTLVVGWLNQRAEKERHLRELALEIALADFKKTVEIYKERDKDVTAEILSPVNFVPFAYASVSKFLNGDINADDIPNVYAELGKIHDKNAEEMNKM